MARQSLGRGLSALLGDDTVSETSTNEIDVDLIDPNPEQPRSRFTESALDELVQSILANGIVQPIVVRRKGNRYEIVAGERRWRAAQRAGLRRIPAAVKDVSDDKLLELALIENIQREELNPVEEAAAYRKLIDTMGLTQEALAASVGKDRTLIATSLRLLKLPADIQRLIEEGKLSAGHGRALLLTDDVSVQRRVARSIIERSLSVREAERIVRNSGQQRRKSIIKKPEVPAKDPNFAAAETKLRRRLGTAVNIIPNTSGTGGRMEIEYYNQEDLDRIYQTIIE